MTRCGLAFSNVVVAIFLWLHFSLLQCTAFVVSDSGSSWRGGGPRSSLQKELRTRVPRTRKPPSPYIRDFPLRTRARNKRISKLLLNSHRGHHRGHQHISPKLPGPSNVHTIMEKTTPSTTNLASTASALELEARDEVQRYQDKDIMDDTICSNYKIFCDLDGVLVDFEAGVQTILNRPTSHLPKHIMWKGIMNADRFFERLQWMRGGQKLWNAIKHLSPDILTGVPDYHSSRLEKFNWCQRELASTTTNFHHVDMAAGGRQGENFNGFDMDRDITAYYDHSSVNGNHRKEGVCNIITCWSFNKHHESHSRAVLIDDRIALKAKWEARGGIFIHHTDVDSTLRKLKEYGVLKDVVLA